MGCARGEDLVSALEKLATPEDALLLQATASSFINHRLARLTAADPRPTVTSNMMLAVAFSAVVTAAAIGPIAQSAANYACALTHAPRAAVKGGVFGGVRGGVKGGVSGGIRGGIRNGIRGGIN